MIKRRLAVALVAALALLALLVPRPLLAQFGTWIRVAGGQYLRVNTSVAAVLIRQDGSGPALSLSYNGSTNSGVCPTCLGSTGLLTAQAANITTTNIPGASSAPASGVYLACAWAAVTQAATTSSTLPNVTIGFSNGTAQTVTLTSTSAGNTVNTFQQACTPIRVGGQTAITYATGSYASTGATPMQYELWVTLSQVY